MAVETISLEVVVPYCPCIQVVLAPFLGLTLRYCHFLFLKINIALFFKQCSFHFKKIYFDLVQILN